MSFLREGRPSGSGLLGWLVLTLSMEFLCRFFILRDPLPRREGRQLAKGHKECVPCLSYPEQSTCLKSHVYGFMLQRWSVHVRTEQNTA